MSRKERRPQRSARLEALLERGDWRAAGAEARALLADPGADEVEREAAEAARARLRPEPGALAVGAAGLVALAVAVVLGLLAR
ncbi:MAG TPA: hypothetical protein VFI16_10295 [Anaeromyxobacteraceae bacterium]|nr:hypothetical protein [Anaeromyxobacteraceae bacterium]